jgi:hypothetical protein
MDRIEPAFAAAFACFTTIELRLACSGSKSQADVISESYEILAPVVKSTRASIHVSGSSKPTKLPIADR